MRLLNIDEVSTNWHLISYGASKTCGTDKVKDYLLGLAKNLMAAKSQCWFLDEDGEVKLMIITRIIDDNNIKKMVITNLFGFKTTRPEEQGLFMDEIYKEAEKARVDEIVGYMTDERVIALAERHGFSKKYTIVSRKV